MSQESSLRCETLARDETMMTTSRWKMPTAALHLAPAMVAQVVQARMLRAEISEKKARIPEKVAPTEHERR